MTTETNSAPLRQSRTGKRPLDLPSGVQAKVNEGRFVVTGPKGTLERAVPPHVEVKIDGPRVTVTPTIGGRDGARFQGLARALFAGMAKSVATGVVQELELVGTGYRAEVKGTALQFSLGFSHPVIIPLPTGINARVPPESKGTLVVLDGFDRELMGQFAARVRSVKPPEPYGGKGIRYKGEAVRKKAGKSGGKGK